MKAKTVILIIILSLLFVVSCREREKIPHPPYFYFDTIGIGYVFTTDSIGILQPAQGVEIIMQTDNGSGGWFSWAPKIPEKHYITDENGFYQVNFIKSVCTGDFSTSWGRSVYYSHTYRFLHENRLFYRISVEEVRYAKGTLLIDTLIIKQQ
jgi:hypothetical protein